MQSIWYVELKVIERLINKKSRHKNDSLNTL